MKDIFSFFEKPKDPLSFSAIRISLASPEPRLRYGSLPEIVGQSLYGYPTLPWWPMRALLNWGSGLFLCGLCRCFF